MEKGQVGLSQGGGTEYSSYNTDVEVLSVPFATLRPTHTLPHMGAPPLVHQNASITNFRLNHAIKPPN
jgi:hypothetical protein